MTRESTGVRPKDEEPPRREARPRRGEGAVSGRATGFLVGSAPFVALLVVGPALRAGTSPSPSTVLVALVASLAQAAGGLLCSRRPPFGRLLVTSGWLLALAALVPVFLESAALALVAALSAAAFSVVAWGGSLTVTPRLRPKREGPGGPALGALAGAGLVAVAGLLSGIPLAVAGPVAAVSSTFVGLIVLADSWRRRPELRPRLLALAAAPIGLALLLASAREAAVALGVLAAGLSVVASGLSGLRRSTAGGSGWADTALGDPARTMVLSFLILGLVGGWLLSLPASSSGERGVSIIDGIFTSFSAVCVTGLVVLDTPRAFGPFGQAVILLLIQVGGLGIMAFSTAGFAILGRRLTLKQELAAAALLGTEDQAHLRSLLRDVLSVTVWTEGLGFAALTALFLRAGDPIWMALWRGLFTSISAFCNAGFALQTESLVPYDEDPLVLLTVATLIVVGGLGPFVVVSIGRRVRGESLPLHPRVVVVTSACLVLGGAALIGAQEWSHGLGGLPPFHRVTNALFQSVTLRTAGFNSIDLATLHPATVVLMIALMLVGGSPGSTAGGIKTTTLATMLLVVRAAVRGEEAPRVGGYRLSRGTVQRASAVATISVLIALGLSITLLLTQQTPGLSTIFEIVSALGTVGLSLGVTGSLDEVGKVVVIAAMFVGRVGPLTLFLFLSGRLSKDPTLPPERELPAG